MRKTLKITALVLALLLFSTLLVACTFDTYESRLVEAGYDVDKFEQEELEDIKESFDELGYEIKEYLVATNISAGTFELLIVIKFNTTKEAQRYIDEELANTDAVRRGAVILTGSEKAISVALGE